MIEAILIGVAAGAGVALLANILFGGSRTTHRDWGAEARDLALAKLYEARADLMHVESLRQREALRLEQTANDRARREAICEEVNAEMDQSAP